MDYINFHRDLVYYPIDEANYEYKVNVLPYGDIYVYSLIMLKCPAIFHYVNASEIIYYMAGMKEHNAIIDFFKEINVRRYKLASGDFYFSARDYYTVMEALDKKMKALYGASESKEPEGSKPDDKPSIFDNVPSISKIKIHFK